MRVLLINPPRWNELVGKNPSIIEKHRGFNPPLGLLYLASSVRKFSSHEVEVLDAQPPHFTYDQLRRHLESRSYGAVGVSAMTFTLIDVYKTVRLVRDVLPDAAVLLGGTHIHLFPDETIRLRGVDFAVMGEAEESFRLLMDALSDPAKLSQVPGLVYRDGGTIRQNSFLPLRDLDNLPFPERNLLRVEDYSSLLSKGALSTTIITSRGCPFQCAFCDRPLSPITSQFRYRSSANVVDELEECTRLNIRDFLFYDDTFTVKRDRVLAICEEILQRGLRIRWDIRTRVDLVDAEMLRLLKRAGCQAVHYGVEAGNDRILKVINKGFSVAKVREIFRLTQRIGIETLAYFMIGLPSERESDIQDTFDLARELKPDYAHISIFSPYPGTALYSMGLEKGIFQKDIWRDFASDPQEGFKIPVWEEHFSRDQLYEMIVKFYKSFYLRPVYWMSRLTRIRSGAEFHRKIRAGLAVALMKKKDVDSLK
jgi:anaerobic magnesium-protoporphyrin IX monomethyl ester cyclase